MIVQKVYFCGKITTEIEWVYLELNVVAVNDDGDERWRKTFLDHKVYRYTFLYNVTVDSYIGKQFICIPGV